MRYQIHWNDKVIGTTDLAHLDNTMGVIVGDFMPTVEYEQVRAVFRLYATAGTTVEDQDQRQLDRYYAERDALNLRDTNENGVELPVSCVHIADFFEEIGEYQATVWTDEIDIFKSCGNTG